MRSPPTPPIPPSGGYELVVFDMDGTLTVPRSCWVVLHQAFGSNNDGGLDRYLAGELTDQQFMALDVRLWQAAVGRPVTAAEVVGILDTIPCQPGALELLRAILQGPQDLVFITGGLDWLARRLVMEASVGLEEQLRGLEGLPNHIASSREYQEVRVGAPKVELHANHLFVDEQGNLTGKGQVGVVARDKGSLLRAILRRRGLRPEQVVAVGDGPVDIPLLRMAGLGVAVPGAKTEAVQAADLQLERDLTELLPHLGL